MEEQLTASIQKANPKKVVVKIKCGNPSPEAGVGGGTPAPAAVGQEVLPPHPLQAVVDRVEALATETAAMARLDELRQQEGVTDFELGGALLMIRKNHWYGKHATFADLCEREFGFVVRKAQYLIAIYAFLVDAKVPWQEVERLGWTKLRMLCGKIEPDALAGWVSKAEEMTVVQLREALKQTTQIGGGGATSSSVKTKTFRLHQDQAETLSAALERAKEDGSTDVDTVALDYICIEFLSAPPKTVLHHQTGGSTNTGDAGPAGASIGPIQKLRAVGLKGLPSLDPDADPKTLVVEYLKQIGAIPAIAICREAFPEPELSEMNDGGDHDGT